MLRINNILKGITLIKKLLTLFLILLKTTVVYGNEKTLIDIIKITDGDTILAKIDNNQFNIRLIGIDCYETSKIHRAYKQAYENELKIEDVIKKGIQSKKFLEILYEKNKNKDIFLDFKGIDKYGRALGIVYFEKININSEMMKNGGCYMYNY